MTISMAIAVCKIVMWLVWSMTAIVEKTLELRFEVWSEHTFPYVAPDFVKGPEFASGQFVEVGRDGSVIGGAVDEYEFTLTLAFKNIVSKSFGNELVDAEFFSHLTTKCSINVLSQIDVSACRRIPSSGLNVLPVGAQLQIQFAFAVEQVKVNYWV